MANYPYQNYQMPNYGGFAPPGYAPQPGMNYLQTAGPMPPTAMQQQAVQPSVNAPVQTGFSCRPVTSKEEAVAFQIPFDGSTTYFVNTSNGEIYAKAYNFANGSAPIETYIKKTPSEKPSPVVSQMPDYSPMFNSIGERLDYLAGQVNEIMGRLDPKPVEQRQKMPPAKGKGNNK